VNKRFDQVNERFGQVIGRFAQMDEKFTQVHQESRAIRKELEGVVYRPECEGLQDRVRDMERLLTTLRKKTA
jgi:hypothetical protein